MSNLTVNTCGDEMYDALNDYLEYIKNDYCNWQNEKDDCDEISKEVRRKMREKFIESVRYIVGKKYIRVIEHTSVHSFICAEDTGKFRKGDILKAASYNAPAKNFSRGNIFDRNFSRITWTGAH